jgi:hypothetical protein
LALENQDGEVVTSEQGLISTVQSAFEEWFCADNVVKENQTGRDKALELVTTRLTTENNADLMAEPTDEEIERVIRDMKKEKSPGIDGVTAEMMLGCWEFLGSDCCAVIHKFWQTKRLLKQLLAAIIKLIPKGGERQLIKHWRPISLLNVPYKVNAKL